MDFWSKFFPEETFAWRTGNTARSMWIEQCMAKAMYILHYTGDRYNLSIVILSVSVLYVQSHAKVVITMMATLGTFLSLSLKTCINTNYCIKHRTVEHMNGPFFTRYLYLASYPQHCPCNSKAIRRWLSYVTPNHPQEGVSQSIWEIYEWIFFKTI